MSCNRGRGKSLTLLANNNHVYITLFRWYSCILPFLFTDSLLEHLFKHSTNSSILTVHQLLKALNIYSQRQQQQQNVYNQLAKPELFPVSFGKTFPTRKAADPQVTRTQGGRPLTHTPINQTNPTRGNFFCFPGKSPAPLRFDKWNKNKCAHTWCVRIAAWKFIIQLDWARHTHTWLYGLITSETGRYRPGDVWKW